MSDLNDKKIEILQVSEKLFAELVFEGTSVRDIAAAANIRTSAAIMRAFKKTLFRLNQRFIIFLSLCPAELILWNRGSGRGEEPSGEKSSA